MFPIAGKMQIKAAGSSAGGPCLCSEKGMLLGDVTGRLAPAKHVWRSLHSTDKLPKHRCSIVNSEVLSPVHCLSGTHNKLTVIVQVFFNSSSYLRPHHWRPGLMVMIRPAQQEESHLSWFEKIKKVSCTPEAWDLYPHHIFASFEFLMFQLQGNLLIFLS